MESFQRFSKRLFEKVGNQGAPKRVIHARSNSRSEKSIATK